MKFHKIFLAGFLVLAMAGSANALPFTITDLYNTGVDNNGTVLAGGAHDTHYDVTSAPAGQAIPADLFVFTNIPTAWTLLNNTTSKWIGLQASGTATDRPGSYTYEIPFTVPVAADLSSVQITGRWAADNRGTNILLNGNSLTLTTLPAGSNAYTQWTSFIITADLFLPGRNTLDFIVLNTGSSASPTGLRVELSGSGEIPDVPEPSTFILLGAGLSGLALLRRRVRR